MGTTRAFEEDLIAMLPRLRRFAGSLTGQGADGDDLCQLTIERALRSRQQWQEGTRLDQWMFRIMRNIWIDEIRARRRRGAQADVDVEAVAPAVSGGQEARTELMMVDRAMAQLPDEQREAVLLVLVEGYGYREAADIIGCPVGTLTSRLGRGREALMHYLGQAA